MIVPAQVLTGLRAKASAKSRLPADLIFWSFFIKKIAIAIMSTYKNKQRANKGLGPRGPARAGSGIVIEMTEDASSDELY